MTEKQKKALAQELLDAAAAAQERENDQTLYRLIGTARATAALLEADG
jgi:hypothetical protein